MEKARIAILEAAIDRQKKEIDNIYIRIDDRSKGFKNEAMVESLSYQLHNLYCAYEDMFKLIAQTFENNIEDGTRWHKELLNRMSLFIKGIRPNLISEESAALFTELRAFRHFFRHAYAYELDAKKVKLVLEKALELKAMFEKDLAGFICVLKKTQD